MKIADRLDGVSESATLKLNAMVAQLKAQGKEVFNFSTGEPDFPPHPEIKAAVVEALEANRSKYTPVPGIPELRELVAKKTNADQPSLSASPWKATHVVLSNGGKQAIFNTLLALLNAGDEVLIPSPYWLSYPEMVKLCGGRPKVISTAREQGYQLEPAQLLKAISPKTRLLILNSPSNPTGALMPRARLSQIAEVLKRREHSHILVISDEIYDRIVFSKEPFCSFLDVAPELKDRVITVNGLSKSAALTGWRIGWTVAETGLTQAIQTIQGQMTSGISALSQAAAVAALKLPADYFAKNLAVYRSRRETALALLSKSRTIKVFPPEGAFYLFLDVGGALQAGEDSTQFAERLLSEAGVAVVPGTPFGAPQCVRLSFATDERTIEQGLTRLVEFAG